jgi:acetoin utilization deacetylase AcuC-like enzyme/GNAT superfamily N-acetyltransferase
MDRTNAATRTRLVYDPAELRYDFGRDHPFQSRRLVALLDLLESSHLWQSTDEQQHLPFLPATPEALALIHTPDYIAAVQHLSIESEAVQALSQQERARRAALAQQYGFDEGDTPPFPAMHEISATIAGGTLAAVSAVLGLPEGGTFSAENERPLHVFHPAGGLHHAWAERASGFCIYNDCAVAIAYALRATEAKILYIDFDAHHGDGVQRAFYDDPRVMTISLHETGRYLFPGTGDALEIGQGSGRGYAVNMPFEPFTEDDSYLEVMNMLLPPLVLSFAPDLIISQHGCDTHAWDPLSHLALTLRGIKVQVQLAHQLAHTYCHGRWVALGGGGYDQFRVVPRAWSILWAEMSEQPLPAQLPEAWIARWRPEWEREQEQEAKEQLVMEKEVASADFPITFEDTAQAFPAQPRRWSISRENQRTAVMIRHLLLPSLLRRAFAPTPLHTPMAGLFDLLHPGGNAVPSRVKTWETSKGPLLLRDFCPPSLVERLRADEGLHAFARLAEREQALLLDIAKNPDCALSLAHTPDGVMVGEVTLTFGDEWWEGIDELYEVTIEVSSTWRNLGIARQLLAFALEIETLEDMILFAMGLTWHWDIEGMGMTPHGYRERLARLFASQGFIEYSTTEPNINMEPANILLVRVGKRVDPFVVKRFLKRIGGSPRIAHP